MPNQQQPRQERPGIYEEPSRPEYPSTYVVEDRSNQEELRRLHLQDRLLTEGQGGVLPEQPDPTAFQRVLDVGCGTGGWLIETARVYPTIKLLIGVDVSRTFVEYARAQAEAARVSDRVEFHVMDALRMLEFPIGFFDLVNQRFAGSWLRTWDWSKLLQEYQRVARPRGVVRITEPDIFPEEDSPALSRLHQLMVRTFERSGHLFFPHKKGITGELAKLLLRYGFLQVQTCASLLEYRAGTSAWHTYVEDMRHGLHTLLPFLEKWTRVPKDYQALCQQAFSEMQQPDFVATLHLLTAWGINPPRRAQTDTAIWSDRG